VLVEISFTQSRQGGFEYIDDTLNKIANLVQLWFERFTIEYLALPER